MKKMFFLLFTILLVSISSAEAREINIGRDVVLKVIMGEDGTMEKEAMFLPLRKSCEALGYKVKWDVNCAKVYDHTGTEVLVAFPGSEEAILIDNKIYVSSTVFEEKFSVRVMKK